MVAKIIKYLKRLIRSFRRSMRRIVPINIPVYHSELLKGRTALITGGTSGIGYSIAEAFVQSGCNIVITGRSQEKLDRAILKLSDKNNSNVSISTAVLNNTDNGEQIGAKFNEITLNSPNLDILVNNAGVSGGQFGQVNDAEYDYILNTNLRGPYLLTQVFADYLKSKNRAGNILNIASSSSARPAATPYMLSKWGVKGMTLGLAKMLIPYDIIVNGIAPGPTMTPMMSNDNYNGIEHSSSPLGRFATSEEIANMAVVLVSDMGKTIVGDTIYMTGGCGTITYDDQSYIY